MTIPIEELHSMDNTRQFLRDLLSPQVTPKVPRVIRDRASSCLKHYPWKATVEKLWEKRITKYDNEIRLSHAKDILKVTGITDD